MSSDRPAAASDKNNTPHVAPTFQVPSSSPQAGDQNAATAATATLTKTRSRRDRERDRRGTLQRTISHREWYDAERASICSESGSYTTEDHAALAKQKQRQQHSRTKSGGGTNSGGGASAVNRPSSRDGNLKAAPPQHETLVEEAHEYISKDAQEQAEEQEILQDVQRGHSGESIREKQVKRDHHQQQQNREGQDANTVDLEKQTESAASSQSSVDETTTTARSSEEEEHKDPNIVTWDSPDSMENPRNWSLHRRWSVIVIVSSYTFLSPLSSSMIAPALPTISEQFNITSNVLQSLMLSVFILAYAIGPLFLAPLSEMFGRRVVLQTSNVFFIVFTIACAVAQNRVQLSIFRFFAGLGGSAPLTIGGGTVSDLMLPEERGVAMSIYSLGPLMGPALGPIIGGWIVQGTHGQWRWIFGVACIAAGVTAAIGVFILPETYAPKILGDKAARLRKETGNEKLHTVFDKNAVTVIDRFKHNMVRPFILIGTQPIIQVLAVYLMIIYGCVYLVLTTFNEVFQTVYHESVGIASLNYLSLALGFTLGGQICGRFNDYNYKRLKAANGGVGQPEFKLPIMMATGWMPCVGLIIYGWSAQYAVHWIVPNIGSAILAFGMISTFQCVQTYTVDTYTLYAASALSANTFLRSLAGFALPLGSGALYKNLGYGWGNTLLGLIAAVCGIPAPFILYRYGKHIRSKSQYASG